MSIKKPQTRDKTLNNAEIEPKTPRTPLGSGGIATHSYYWDIRRKAYDNRKND